MSESGVKFPAFRPAEETARRFAYLKSGGGKSMPASYDELAEWLLEFDKYLAAMVDKQHELMVEWMNTCICRGGPMPSKDKR